jgi:hypothetical protein
MIGRLFNSQVQPLKGSPMSTETESTPDELPHKYDDEGICIYCQLDGAEAHFYSQRGYAHEYPEYFEPCMKRRSAAQAGAND